MHHMFPHHSHLSDVFDSMDGRVAYCSYPKRPPRIHIAECQSSTNRLFPRLSRSTCLRLPRIPILPSFVTFAPPLTYRSEVEEAGLLLTLLISSSHLTDSCSKDFKCNISLDAKLTDRDRPVIRYVCHCTALLIRS